MKFISQIRGVLNFSKTAKFDQVREHTQAVPNDVFKPQSAG